MSLPIFRVGIPPLSRSCGRRPGISFAVACGLLAVLAETALFIGFLNSVHGYTSTTEILAAVSVGVLSIPITTAFWFAVVVPS